MFRFLFVFVFNDTATTEIYTYFPTLSLHAALPISGALAGLPSPVPSALWRTTVALFRSPVWLTAAFEKLPAWLMLDTLSLPSWNTSATVLRSEEHTSELQSLMRISYAVFCLKKKKKNTNINQQKTIILLE